MSALSAVITILDLVSFMLFIIWGARGVYVGMQAMDAVNHPQLPDVDPSPLRKYDGAVRRKRRIRVGGIPFAIGALGIGISYILTSLGNEIAGAIGSGVSLLIIAGKVLSPAIVFIVKVVGGGKPRQ